MTPPITPPHPPKLHYPPKHGLLGARPGNDCPELLFSGDFQSFSRACFCPKALADGSSPDLRKSEEPLLSEASALDVPPCLHLPVLSFIQETLNACSVGHYIQPGDLGTKQFLPSSEKSRHVREAARRLIHDRSDG